MTKVIYLRDLAQLYFPNSTPHSAVTQLHRWVGINTELNKRLAELHMQPRQRVLTPLQYEAYIYYLGEPGE